jgi:HEAT repeat protein
MEETRYAQMKYLIPVFATLMVNLSVLPGTIFAQNENYYNQVLQFGTDADMARSFATVKEDLGDEINKKVLSLFREGHSRAVYTALVRYIAVAGMDGAEQVLIQELENGAPDEDYREECIVALGVLKKPSSIPFLRSYYFNNSSTQRTKKAIIDAWGTIGDPSIEATLMDIAGDAREDSEVRGRAIIALGKVKSVHSLDLLEDIARNRYEDRHLSMYAVYSLGEVGGESVLGTLGELIDDERHEVAEYAVQSISNIASEKGGVYLMRALRSDFDKVRYYAVIGLRQLQYRDAVKMLAFKAQYDMNETVRKEAEKTLELLRGEEEE